MKLFTEENRRVIVDPTALLIKEFKKLHDRDKSNDKAKALEDLAFVYYYADYNSPYNKIPDKERIEKLKKDCITQTSWKKDKQIDEAIKKYEELQLTPTMALVKSAENALNKLRDYFDDVDLIGDKQGIASKNLVSNMKGLGDIVKSYQQLKEVVKKEMTENQSNLRGGGKIGRRELPKR